MLRSGCGDERSKRERARMRALGVVATFTSLLILAAVPAPAEVEPALSAEVGSPQKLSANLGINSPDSKATASP